MNSTPRLTVLTLAALASPALAQSPANDARTSAPPLRPELVSHFWWNDFDSNGTRDALVVHPNGTAVVLTSHGDGSFEDVTERVGLAGLTGVAQALWQDVDADGSPELYLVVPGGESRLVDYADGTFIDVTQAFGLDVDATVLRGEWLDVDGDELPDLHLSTDRGELLFHGVDGASFEEIDLGLGSVDVPWSPEIDAWAGGRTSTDPASANPGQPGAPANRGAAPSAPGSSSSSWVGNGTMIGPNPDVGQGSMFCYDTIQDQISGNCMSASSVPMMGMLYPISQEWYVDATTGYVGIGTTSPVSPLDVNGNANISGRIIARNAAGNSTIVLDPRDSMNGVVRVRDAGGNDRVTLSGADGSLTSVAPDTSSAMLSAGALLLEAPGGSTPSATLSAQGSLGDGRLALTDSAQRRTAELRGDSGLGAGSLVLTDQSTGNSVSGLQLYGRSGIGPRLGGLLTIWNGAGKQSVRVEGNNGVGSGRVVLRTGQGLNYEGAALVGRNGDDVGALLLKEADGSRSFEIEDTGLTAFNAGGSQTFQIDRTTGDATQLVSADGLVKAAIVINGNTGQIIRAFNNVSGSLTVQRFSEGNYRIRFVGANLSNRFYSVTTNQLQRRHTSVVGVGETVLVSTSRTTATFSPTPPPGFVILDEQPADTNFTLFVY